MAFTISYLLEKGNTKANGEYNNKGRENIKKSTHTRDKADCANATMADAKSKNESKTSDTEMNDFEKRNTKAEGVDQTKRGMSIDKCETDHRNNEQTMEERGNNGGKGDEAEKEKEQDREGGESQQKQCVQLRGQTKISIY